MKQLKRKKTATKAEEESNVHAGSSSAGDSSSEESDKDENREEDTGRISSESGAETEKRGTETVLVENKEADDVSQQAIRDTSEDLMDRKDGT